MTEEAKEEVKTVLMLLKNTLIKNHVSIGINNEDKKIFFFDTEKYIADKNFSGFSINIDDLVK